MADFRPDFLFDEDRIQAGREWQDELRQKYGTKKLAPQIKELQYTAGCVDAVLTNIQSQLAEGNDEALKKSYNRLAELLTELGQFEEAAEAAKLGDDGYWKERTAALHKAFTMPDDEEHCDCPNLTEERDPQTNRFIENNYNNRRYLIGGQPYVEVMCNLCGASNVKEEK